MHATSNSVGGTILDDMMGSTMVASKVSVAV
jgi:hypothetical protein